MDTVYVKLLQGSNQIALNDSLMSQLKLVTNQYINKPHDFDFSILIPLLSALLGGILAIGGQWVIKYIDSQKNIIIESKEIVSLCAQLRLQLFFYFNSYAYFEQNTEYQFLQYKLEKETVAKEKYLDEHYKSNEEMLNLHKTLIDFISQFLGKATKFMILAEHKISFQNEFNQIESIEFGYAKDYSSLETLVSDDQVSSDIAELTQKYQDLLPPFINIVNSMTNYLDGV